MNYSIGEVSRMFGLPQSTLRYYDKEGLLPHIQRQGAGIRRFDEQAIEALRVIECLKKSGMEIKDIRQFMIWCGEGASTYQQRLELFQRRRAEVEQELARHTLHFRQQSGFAGEDHCEYVYTVFLPRRRTAGDFSAQMTGVAGVQQAHWVRG